jgi:hypothetical protein
MNLGYIPAVITAEDWRIGGQGDFFSPVNSTALISGNNWEEWLPVIEYQNQAGFDRMACVTYSLMNCFEILNIQETGKELNFSDRYIAKLSNTSRQGNTLPAVFDEVRENGLVKESVWPDVLTDWDDYYKQVPANIIGSGKEFIKDYDVYREYVATYKKDLIFEALNHAPLQVIVEYASGDGILNPGQAYNHAVTCYGAKKNEYWLIYDHYTQTRKKYAWDYEFAAILKPTFKLKKPNMLKVKNGFMYLLVEGPTQKLGMGLDGALVVFADKVDCLINSSSRLKIFEPAIPVTLAQWSSVKKVDSKGKKI